MKRAIFARIFCRLRVEHFFPGSQRGANVIHQSIMVLIRMSKLQQMVPPIGRCSFSLMRLLKTDQTTRHTTSSSTMNRSTTKMWTFLAHSLSYNDEGCAYSNELILSSPWAKLVFLLLRILCCFATQKNFFFVLVEDQHKTFKLHHHNFVEQSLKRDHYIPNGY